MLAGVLGNCGGGISREHLISASQFEGPAIIVSGLPWCPTPKRIGIAGLASHILCRAHNSALAPVDAEAARFKDALRAMLQPHPARVSIQARLVERWLLKTTINLALQGGERTLAITESLARIAFGHQPAPTGRGFFFVAAEGEQKKYDPDLQVVTIVAKETRQLALAAFHFHGFQMIYAFDGALR